MSQCRTVRSRSTRSTGGAADSGGAGPTVTAGAGATAGASAFGLGGIGSAEGEERIQVSSARSSPPTHLRTTSTESFPGALGRRRLPESFGRTDAISCSDMRSEFVAQGSAGSVGGAEGG